MLNPEVPRTSDFQIACLGDTLAAALIDRWVTAADRSYAAERPRPLASLSALAALRALVFAATRRTGWIVTRTPSGMPSLTTVDGQPGPSISLSHTAGLIAVAVAASGEIGIDVERHRPRDFAALAEQAFGSVERQDVATGGQQAFYRIWTLREAIAKATGDGLALMLGRGDLAAGTAADRPHRRGRWNLLHAVPEPGFTLGVAWSGSDRSGLPHWVDLGSMTDGRDDGVV